MVLVVGDVVDVGYGLGLGSFTKSLWLIYKENLEKRLTYSCVNFVSGYGVINFHV